MLHSIENRKPRKPHLLSPAHGLCLGSAFLSSKTLTAGCMQNQSVVVSYFPLPDQEPQLPVPRQAFHKCIPPECFPLCLSSLTAQLLYRTRLLLKGNLYSVSKIAISTRCQRWSLGVGRNKQSFKPQWQQTWNKSDITSVALMPGLSHVYRENMWYTYTSEATLLLIS